MPTRIVLGERTLEIEGADAQEVSTIMQALTGFLQTAAASRVAVPSPQAVQEVARELEEATGLQVVNIPSPEPPSVLPPVEPPLSVPEHPPGVPARRSPRVESDPAVREKQRQAAANAREALAAKRAAKAQAAAGTGDMSGDREDGDREHGPDSEPTDPHAAQAGAPPKRVNGGNGTVASAMTATQKMQVLFEALQDVAKVSTSGREEVIALVRRYGVTKVKDVPAEKIEEFYADTEVLCGTFNVTFPPDAGVK